jgi:molybdenum cofactor cytidylyltransferase
LGAWQLELADEHVSISGMEDLGGFLRAMPEGVVALTGRVERDQRIGGLPAQVLGALAARARQERLPLLIEADGAHMRPLKAPAEHEPAIPPFVEEVIVVAGLSGLGQPLREQWVHRPERFAALSGLSLGETITPGALQRVLLHPRGGMKNIPPGARRKALLSQADTPERQSLAQGIGEGLLGAFLAVVIAGEERVHAVLEPTAGIILAAGGSQRFGQPKQLLTWQGEPLVRRAALTAQRAGLSPVIAVVGAHAGQVEKALDGLEVQIARNADWQNGQSTSVRAGVEAIPAESGAVIFLLVDQPRVSPELVRALAATHRQGLASIVAPLIEGRRGNPVLFDRDLFPALLTLSGDQGGRALFSRYPVEWLPWHDAGLLLDIDTPEDYRLLQEA